MYEHFKNEVLTALSAKNTGVDLSAVEEVLDSVVRRR